MYLRFHGKAKGQYNMVILFISALQSQCQIGHCRRIRTCTFLCQPVRFSSCNMKAVGRRSSGPSRGVRGCGLDPSPPDIAWHRQRQDSLGSSDSHHRISQRLGPRCLLRPHRRGLRCGLACRLLGALRRVCPHSIVLVRRRERPAPRLPLAVSRRYDLD